MDAPALVAPIESNTLNVIFYPSQYGSPKGLTTGKQDEDSTNLPRRAVSLHDDGNLAVTRRLSAVAYTLGEENDRHHCKIRVYYIGSSDDDDYQLRGICSSRDPISFEGLRKVAGGNVIAREGPALPKGEVFVIEVDPEPATLMPKVINASIANDTLLKEEQCGTLNNVAAAYDSVASEYDTHERKEFTTGVRRIVNTFDFSGTIFDLACGTGTFGRILSQSKTAKQPTADSHVIGFDIAPGTLDICRGKGHYDAVYIASMETALVNCHRYATSVDHVVCISAIHHLCPEAFSFVLVLCLALANKSITISIDEIPDEYNEYLQKNGMGFMHSTNHLANMEAFGEPPGWHVTRSESQFSWTSPKTGHRVYTTYFRFDRVGKTSWLK